MSDIPADVAALADLGSRFLGLVVASQRLGHESYSMTAHYAHGSDAAGRLVTAVARGRSRAGEVALAEWLDDKGLETPSFIRPA